MLKRCLQTVHRLAIPACMLVLLSTQVSHAQVASDQQSTADASKTEQPRATSATSAARQLQEVTVTGSRIVTSGFAAPTPVVQLSVAQIEQSGVTDISTFMEEQPQVLGSRDLHTSTVFNGQAGMSSISLRSLGEERTLVMLDGYREMPSDPAGSNMVDTTMIPQELVKRVDIVTGGASAVYGADALAGVVNFVLDHDFTGFKVDVSDGRTIYNDDRDVKASLAFGTRFAGDRGHFMVGAEYTNNQGIPGSTDGAPSSRGWLNNPPALIHNNAWTPNNGLPDNIFMPDSSTTLATIGGLIETGAAANTYFGPGGVPLQYNPGYVGLAGMSAGGDYQASSLAGQSWLDEKLSRQGILSRIDFLLTDHLNLYAMASFNHSYAYSNFCCDVELFKPISATNPYLPASIQQTLANAGQSSFFLGEFMSCCQAPTLGDKDFNRFALGLEGDFDVFGRNWKWDLADHYARSRSLDYRTGQILEPNFALALDAVINPATGAITCRVTLTNPNSPCQPFNPFGPNAASQAAIAYIGADPNNIAGSADQYAVESQHDVTANLHGNPLTLPAGAVAIAVGAEYRDFRFDRTVDANSLAGNWNLDNYTPESGTVSVTEEYLETEIPLLKDAILAKALDLNAAVRSTNYSTSGRVTTWKAGLVWAPIEDFRIRATRSRDIRAPSIDNLYSKGGGGVLDDTVVDPFNGGRTNTQLLSQSVGNPSLKPEVADTTTVGIVLQPTFVPNFQFSVDYFNIDVKDWIAVPSLGSNTSIADQTIVNLCYQGVSVYCSDIIRDPTTQEITFIRQQPLNFQTALNRGIDLEGVYHIRVPGGELGVNYVATHYIKSLRDVGLGAPLLNEAGVNNIDVTGGADYVPWWRQNLSVTYNTASFVFGLTGRFMSAGKRMPNWIECGTNCPTNLNYAYYDTVAPGLNHMPGYFYLDGNFAYELPATWGAESRLYFNVRNIFNRDPPVVGRNFFGSWGAIVANTVPGLYDVEGTTFQLGVSLRF